MWNGNSTSISIPNSYVKMETYQQINNLKKLKETQRHNPVLVVYTNKPNVFNMRGYLQGNVIYPRGVH